MKKLLFLCLAFLTLYIFLVKCTSEPASEQDVETTITKEGYMPFPQGFDYPVPEATINQWISSGDESSIRQHAWSLWAGLNKTDATGTKVWQSWHNLNQIFDGLSGSGESGTTDTMSAATAAEMAEKYGLAPFYPSNPNNCGNDKAGRFINTVDALLLFSIYYNQEIHDWIVNKDLQDTATLEKMLKEGKKDIPHAPEEAFLLKQIYYPVKAGNDHYTVLPVWDGPGDRDPLGYNGFETWKRAVAVTTNPDPPATVPVEYLYGLINRDSFNYQFPAAKTVSVKQFYYLKLDAKTLASFSKDDSCIVNTTFEYVHNEGFEEGDYLVTIAMHYLTKEISDWTMQTVWWHDEPNEGPFAADRPTDIPAGKWQNYLLAHCYYMAVPNEPGGEPFVAFNPYIELMVPEENRMRSNCQNCHRRAGHPIMPSVFVNPIGMPPSYTPGANYDPLQEGFITDADTIFNGVLRTDFNWGIPMNAN